MSLSTHVLDTARGEPAAVIERPGSDTAQKRCLSGPMRASPTHTMTSSQNTPT